MNTARSCIKTTLINSKKTPERGKKTTRKCTWRADVEATKSAAERQWWRGVIKRTCRQCGKAITTWRRKAYCSQECSVVGRMEYPRKRYANNPEKAIEISRRWRKNNPEKYMESRRRSDEKRRRKAMWPEVSSKELAGSAAI